jgi:hypothetical protein
LTDEGVPVKPTEQYIERALLLPEEVTNQLLVTGHVRFLKDPHYRHLQPLEKVAVQLQYEDVAHQEWMTKVAQLRQREAANL